MTKILIAVILCFNMVGCALFTKKPDVIITPKVVNIDTRFYELCENLNIIPTNPSDTDVLNTLISNIEIYKDCKNKQEASVKLLKQFSNYKEPAK